MRLLILNSVLGYGSTGRICLDIAKEYEQKGYEVKVAYGRNFGPLSELAKKYGVRIGNDMDVYLHGIYSRVTDKHGLGSKRATRAFLKWASDFNPDMLWLHNVHGYYINYEMLFEWIKSRPDMKVNWTLHDCWTFTGHCAHFTYVKCNKWQKGCYDCPQISEYPKSFNDYSRQNYERKKKAFTGVRDLTIITPSMWLKKMVSQSYLAEYNVEVVYNTVDKKVFRNTENTFKEEHGFPDKKMILGVANNWNQRKGLDDYIELSRKIDDSLYRIVLVGLTDSQIKDFDKAGTNILAFTRTPNAGELVKMYSAADVFVNPTYEDTFPTVNLEAEACGTRVVTYNTGGCAETIHRPDSIVIEPGVENIIKVL